MRLSNEWQNACYWPKAEVLAHASNVPLSGGRADIRLGSSKMVLVLRDRLIHIERFVHVISK
jgi:hypothetical protein